MRQLLVAFILLISPCLAYPESVEGFSFGGNADDIVQRIGEPTAVDGPVFDNQEKAWVWSWDYNNYGALFEVESLTPGGRKKIRSITMVPPCAWKLSSGLGLGDSSRRITDTYSKVDQSSPDLWFVVSSDKRNVTGFELTGSRIKSIFLGTRTK